MQYVRIFFVINPSKISEQSYFNSTRALVKLGWKVKLGGLENQGGSEGLGNGNSLFSYGKKKPIHETIVHFVLKERLFVLILYFIEFCPTVFDGWTCIEATPAGQVAKVSCPAFYNFNFHEESK